MNFIQNYNTEAKVADQSRFMTRVYLWMAFGLFSTAYTSYITAHSSVLLNLIFSTQWFFWGLLIAQLGLVIGLSACIQRISGFVATLLFFVYSILTGLTLSVVLLAYTQESVLSAFGVSGGAFAILSTYGFVTKRDLSPIGSFLMMALFGLILAMLVNLFFHNSVVDLAISSIAVLIFAGLTAYDTQKLKTLCAEANTQDGEITQRITVMGALTLYLDFINLFLNILRLMGRRR